MESGLDLTEENILSLLLQTSMPHNTDLRTEFDNRLDTVLSWNNERPISFNRTVDLLISIQQRVNDWNTEQRREDSPPPFWQTRQHETDRTPSPVIPTTSTPKPLNRPPPALQQTEPPEPVFAVVWHHMSSLNLLHPPPPPDLVKTMIPALVNQ
ncbi:hypothetical protein MJO29_000258 [Puccinia striiformis f. sp. tritici]|nr:hypothetical protein MJO29_000258 [Puccinia striiformis f. sp. tritici]